MNSMVENVRATDALLVSNDAGFELWKDKAATFIDVRDFDEFRQGHIEDAAPMPLSDFEMYKGFLPEKLDTPIVTVCNRGNQSLSGVLQFKSLGYTDVRSLDGGTIAWQEAGRPVSIG